MICFGISDIRTNKHGLMTLDVGEFQIQITTRNRVKDIGDDIILYKDEGRLFIYFQKPIKANIGPDDLSEPTASKEFTMGIIRDSSFALAQIACFGGDKRVPATPENIVQAIRWYQANPNFMKSGEGI